MLDKYVVGISIGIVPGTISLRALQKGAHVFSEFEGRTAIVYDQNEFMIGKDAVKYASKHNLDICDNVIERFMQGDGESLICENGNRTVKDAAKDFLIKVLDEVWKNCWYYEWDNHNSIIDKIVVALPGNRIADDDAKRRLTELFGELWESRYGFNAYEPGRVEYMSAVDVVAYDLKRITEYKPRIVLTYRAGQAAAEVIIKDKDVHEVFISEKEKSPLSKPYSQLFDNVDVSDLRKKAAVYYSALDPKTRESCIDASLRTRSDEIISDGNDAVYFSSIAKDFDEHDNGALEPLLSDVRKFFDGNGGNGGDGGDNDAIEIDDAEIYIVAEPEINGPCIEHYARLAFGSLDGFEDDRFMIRRCDSDMCTRYAADIAMKSIDFASFNAPYSIAFRYFDPMSNPQNVKETVISGELRKYSEPEFIDSKFGVPNISSDCVVRMVFSRWDGDVEIVVREPFNSMFTKYATQNYYNVGLAIDRSYCPILYIRNGCGEVYKRSLKSEMKEQDIDWNFLEAANEH